MDASTMTPEERAEEKRRRTRAERISAIHKVIDKTKGPISTAEIAQKTGYSEGLVLSTMRLVNRTVGDIAYPHKSDQAMYAYSVAKDGNPAGWTIASRWDDRANWHLTLHRHVTTRCESLKAEADVAEALWPGDAPAGLAGQYGTAIYALDAAGALIESLKGVKGKTPKPKPVNRGVRQVG